MQKFEGDFGFLNINKPKGITSFDVIFKLRKLLNIKKIGHAGTLDPLAKGVLPVAVGDCTKLIEYLKDDKEYEATVKFGETSTTFDEEGEKTYIKTPNFLKKELQDILNLYKGTIEQTVPLYSAVKVKGKKLYELARKGIETDTPVRKINIFKIEILDFSLPCAKIKVACSAGTYIRSLANDIGQKLGCGAYLTDLTRTRAGNFILENATDINEVKGLINPLDVLDIKTYELNESEFSKVKNGNPIPYLNHSFKEGDDIALVYNKKLVSISKISDKIIRVKKVFSQNIKGVL